MREIYYKPNKVVFPMCVHGFISQYNCIYIRIYSRRLLNALPTGCVEQTSGYECLILNPKLLRFLVFVAILVGPMYTMAACGLDWTLPANHFESVDPHGYASYWERIGDLDCGGGIGSGYLTVALCWMARW